MTSRSVVNHVNIERQIMDLINSVGGSKDADLLKEMMLTTLRMAEDKTSRKDIKISHFALREMKYANHLFSKYRDKRKVTVFGSARVERGDPIFGQAVSFSRMMVKKGFMIITGAGGGVMKGAQMGAGRKNSFGLNIILPFEQEPNRYIVGDPKLIYFRYFFTRKLFFLREADAVVLFPGGFGTQDEGFETLTLMQTGKSLPFPVVLVDTPGGSYWREWMEYLEDHILARGLISPEDFSFFKITDDIGEAVEEIVRFYNRYHSLRYVKRRLVIRLNSPLTKRMIEKLNDHFNDILSKGKIMACGALPDESDEPEIAHLPRLVLNFKRKNFGRLREFIDAINRF